MLRYPNDDSPGLCLFAITTVVDLFIRRTTLMTSLAVQRQTRVLLTVDRTRLPVLRSFRPFLFFAVAVAARTTALATRA